MNKCIIYICGLLISLGCSNIGTTQEILLIDVVNSTSKYQKVFCSDLFLSLELIPLETTDESLINYPKTIIYKDSMLFVVSGDRLYSFDNTGRFLNQIGKIGQGPDEYISLSSVFSRKDEPIIYVADFKKIIEYDFNGNFIRSFDIPKIHNESLYRISTAGENVFIGEANYNGNNKIKYVLFNQFGEIIKCFPSQIQFNRNFNWSGPHDGSLDPIWIDNRLYIKDFINDTIYEFVNTDLQPAFVFKLGEFSYPIEYLESIHHPNPIPLDAFVINNIIGTPEYFFYLMRFPNKLNKPKTKEEYNPVTNSFRSTDATVYGIYNIQQQTNVFLDSGPFLQKGIINDINGGLSFIPRCYAGDNILVDFWKPEDIIDIASPANQSKQLIKNRAANEKLIELSKSINEYSNPVVVVAKLRKQYK